MLVGIFFVVLLAHAGVIPTVDDGNVAGKSPSRASGGDPNADKLDNLKKASFPHMRG